MQIIVTGANGQLGCCLRQLATERPDWTFYFSDRDELDITSLDAVRKSVSDAGAQYVINCAAYTAVDKAETDLETAMAINCTGAANLAIAAKETGARYIHISTDYVFAGNGTRPYRENDPVDPVNAYGLTKLRGEEAVLQADKEAIILRTSWVYAEHGANFVKTMMRLMSSRPEIGVVADQFGSPTYAMDLAAAILFIVEKGNWVPGIYHFSNEGNISWFDFATAIRDLTGSSCKVNPLTTQDYPTPAKRPAYSVMDKSKISATFGIAIRPWQESLGECLAQLAKASASSV